MSWTVEPVEQSVLFHYSEDHRIARFEPHVPRTNPGVAAAVCAIDEARAPLYWFPSRLPTSDRVGEHGTATSPASASLPDR
jgi:hypothetical protein